MQPNKDETTKLQKKSYTNTQTTVIVEFIHVSI